MAMTRSGPISLADVAELSGVSPSTVSRVLNNHTDNFSVKAGTRERILKVARDLNYRPDPIRRSLRAKQTHLIAVLGMRDFGTAIRGATEVAVNTFMKSVYAEGFELCTNVLSPREPAFAPPRWRVDGAVAMDCSEKEQLNALDESNVPYVTINGPAGTNGSSVRVDDSAGAHDAIMHLIVLGHKRIAFALPDEFNWHESLLSRHEAYLSTLGEFALQPVTPDFEPGMSPLDVVRKTVVQGKATAILVYNHMMAVKLLRACSVLNIRVPQDVSLVCFNDLFPCEDIVPSLTAMSLPSHDMGVKAAELLLERINEEVPSEPVHIQLPEKLVIRESTAPVPAG